MASLKSAFITVYFGYIFRYACLLVLIPFYARVLGPQEYGQVLLATALGNFIWAVQNWGFAAVGARDVAAATSQQHRQHEFSRHLTARMLLLPLSVAVGVAGIAWSPILRESPLLGALGVAWGICSGFNLGWLFQGMDQFKTSITAEIINFGLTLVLVVALVLWRPEASSALWALLVANLLSLAYSYWKASAQFALHLAQVQAGWALLRESLAMFINASVGAMVANAGSYILGLYSTPSQVAYYGTVERLVSTGLGLLAPAAQVLLPRLARLQGQGGSQSALMSQQRKAILGVTMTGLAMSLGAGALGPWVLPMLLGEQFRSSVDVLYAFCPIFVLAAFTSSVSNFVLLPARKDRWISAVGVLSALISVPLMVAVAHAHGASGVAMSRVVVQLVMVGVMVWLWRQVLQQQRLGG